MKTFRHLWQISLNLTMRNVFDKICKGNKNTHFVFNSFFFRKSHRLGGNAEKCGGNKGATNDVKCGSIALHAGQAKLLAHMRKHTPTQIYNTYNFSTAKIIGERSSVLHYTYIACLFSTVFILTKNNRIAQWA